jgi:predicted dehydrogenase
MLLLRRRPERRSFLKSRLAWISHKAKSWLQASRRTACQRLSTSRRLQDQPLTGVAEAARTGALGEVVGADIVVNYSAWPRTWQKEADWLRFREEGGMTREVISHFLFFSERILGPLSVVWARPSYPVDPALCETHMLARLETTDARPVTIMASVGGAQPDRQELTIKGTSASRRITDFYVDAVSDGGPFVELERAPGDPRAVSLKAQLDDLLLCMDGKPNRLATPEEALRVQVLVETMLAGKS